MAKHPQEDLNLQGQFCVPDIDHPLVLTAGIYDESIKGSDRVGTLWIKLPNHPISLIREGLTT